MKMSMRDQNTIGVAIFLLIALLMTFAGYMANQQTHDNAHILATESVTVEGRVINSEERFGGVLNGPKYTWWLDIAYTTKEGETLTKTIGVEEVVYKRVVIGPIPVTYIKSNPKAFFIDGVYQSFNHSDSDAAVVDGLTLYSGIASVVLGLILAGLLLTRGGGNSAPPQIKPAPGPIVRRQPGQFGRRA